MINNRGFYLALYKSPNNISIGIVIIGQGSGIMDCDENFGLWGFCALQLYKEINNNKKI